MRLPSSWQAPPPTHLRIRGTLLGTGWGCPAAQCPEAQPWRAWLEAASALLPSESSAWEADLDSSCCPKEFWVQFEAYYNSGPDALLFCAGDSKKKKKISTRKPREKQGLQE